jgi:hypothetical protein
MSFEKGCGEKSDDGGLEGIKGCGGAEKKIQGAEESEKSIMK